MRQFEQPLVQKLKAKISKLMRLAGDFEGQEL